MRISTSSKTHPVILTDDNKHYCFGCSAPVSAYTHLTFETVTKANLSKFLSRINYNVVAKSNIKKTILKTLIQSMLCI